MVKKTNTNIKNKHKQIKSNKAIPVVYPNPVEEYPGFYYSALVSYYLLYVVFAAR